MPSLQEQALEALAIKEEQQRQREEEDRQRERQRQKVAEDKQHDLFDRSKLTEWFPGHEWELYGKSGGYDSGYVWCTGRPGGTNPMYAKTPCFQLSEEHKYVRVRLVQEHQDRDSYTAYWSGPEVRNAAEVGKVLKEWGWIDGDGS